MAKKKKKRRRRASRASPPKVNRIWKGVIAGGLAIIIGMFANFLDILDFFGVNPSSSKNLTERVPLSPGYVLYESLPDLTWSSALYGQGLEAYKRNDYDVALDKFEAALKEYERLSHADVDTAKIQYAIGIVYKRKGDLNEAIDWYSDSIGTLKQLPNADTEEVRTELAYVHYLRGFSYLKARNLTRALADCTECSDAILPDIGNRGLSSVAAALYLRGKIYTASYYGTHSPYPVHGGTDLGVTWLDAMTCFETALQYKGARLTSSISDYDPNEVIIVDAYNDYGISQIRELLGIEKSPTESMAHYVIYNRDAETAYILTNRVKLLFMKGTLSSMDAAIENCNAALGIYNDLSADERDGYHETCWLLAQIILTRQAMQNGTLDENTIKICTQIVKDGLQYTKDWYGESYETAVGYENMGYISMITSQYDDAAENFEEAQRLFAKLGLDEDAETQSDFLDMVAKCKEEGGDWEMKLVDEFGREYSENG